MSLKSRVEAAIKSVKIAGSGQDLLAAGMVQSVTAGDGEVIVLLEVDAQDAPQLEPTRKLLEDTLKATRGVKSAKVVMTSAQPAGSSALNLQAHKPGRAVRRASPA